VSALVLWFALGLAAVGWGTEGRAPVEVTSGLR
jgi:hypothetical protein